MSQRWLLTIVCLVAAALFFREFEQQQLWRAAENYYLKLAKLNRSIILKACEADLRLQGIFDEDDQWIEREFLQRGTRGLDPENFPWQARYQFVIVYYRTNLRGGKPFEKTSVCEVASVMGHTDGIYADTRKVFFSQD